MEEELEQSGISDKKLNEMTLDEAAKVLGDEDLVEAALETPDINYEEYKKQKERRQGKNAAWGLTFLTFTTACFIFYNHESVKIETAYNYYYSWFEMIRSYLLSIV
jgi:hypothetical protein